MVMVMGNTSSICAAASCDATLRAWDSRTGRAVRLLSGHTSDVASVSIHPDRNMVLTGSADNTCRVWDMGSGKCVATLSGHEGEVTSARFSPSGTTAASGRWIYDRERERERERECLD
jgi:WD40 repeat protein